MGEGQAGPWGICPSANGPGPGSERWVRGGRRAHNREPPQGRPPSITSSFGTDRTHAQDRRDISHSRPATAPTARPAPLSGCACHRPPSPRPRTVAVTGAGARGAGVTELGAGCWRCNKAFNGQTAAPAFLGVTLNPFLLWFAQMLVSYLLL